MSLKVYQAPPSQIINSYLVTLIDGTGSMSGEYEQAVKAYQNVFSYLGDQKLEYQFQSELFPILPYVGVNGRGGNITNTFKDLFTILLSKKNSIPKNITILFISDGRETFDIKVLLPQIEQMKNQFMIQFISFAVGDKFPNEISNILRNKIHNHDPNLQSLFQVRRKISKSKETIYEDFFKCFLQIKPQISVQDGIIIINKQVQQTLVSPLTNQVIAGSHFCATTNEEIVAGNIKLQPKTTDKDINQFIIGSLSQAINDQIANKKRDTKAFKCISDAAPQLLKQITSIQSTPEEQHKSQEVYQLLDELLSQNLELQAMSENQITQLQRGLFDKQVSLNQIINVNSHDIKKKVVTPEILNERLSEQYQKLIDPSSFQEPINQKNQNLTLLESTELIIIETLNNHISYIEKNLNSDHTQFLTDFLTSTQQSLIKVFSASDFKVEQDEQIVSFKQMNSLFQLIDQTIKKLISISNFLILVKKYQQKTQVIMNADASNALFSSNDDYKYLPKELQILLKEGLECEEAEKCIILIVDTNDSMKNESQIAIDIFQTQFQNIPELKKVILVWSNDKFQQIQQQQQEQQQEQQQQQQQKFDSLLEQFKQLDKKYDLCNKRNRICLVTDGQTDYQKLHKSFKVLKFHYSFQIIYLTVGSQINSKIGNELKSKYQDRNIKGCPLLFNVPRSIIQSTSNTSQRIKDVFNKCFEDIYKHFIK
ncbi:unnamed protein product [Paramecium primaurelia]|uniref:VWFA domain-containing protein n=1 Tax=Paramecium primaurelia TaxID=5886 RepID=A0A8S1MPY9_PARPR|nr:unnamed protein product [Paramecium primaurelia]